MMTTSVAIARRVPFVTRTVQRVIEEIEVEVEEASATLGARRLTALRASSCR